MHFFYLKVYLLLSDNSLKPEDEIKEYYPELDFDISKVNKKNFLKAVEMTGEQINALKRAYGNSYKDYQFYDLLIENLESYEN